MAKKKPEPEVNLEQLAQRGLELKERQAADKSELEKDILPIIKRAKENTYGTWQFDGVELETQPQRQLNEARVLRDFGKRATERKVTATSFAALGLSKEEADAYYDTSLPKVFLRRIGGQ